MQLILRDRKARCTAASSMLRCCVTYLFTCWCRAARCISDATPCLKRSQSAADVRINKEASHRRHDLRVFIDGHHLESISSDDGLDMQISPMSSKQQLAFPEKGLQPRPDSSLSLCSQDNSSATMVSQSSSITAESAEHMCALQPVRSGAHEEGEHPA